MAGNELVKQARDIAKIAKIGGLRNTDLVIADVSPSMDEIVSDRKSKYQLLQAALEPYKRKSEVQVLAFSDQVELVDAGELPELYKLGGGTNLMLALQKARSLTPLHALVICDGHPGNRDGCLDEAKRFDCIIDVLYIGPLNDEIAIAFMKNLAEAGRGRYQQFDVSQAAAGKLLESKAARLLAIAPPKDIQL